MQGSLAGILFALAAAFSLGAITPQAKLVYVDGGNAMTVMFWRFAVSVVLIGAIARLYGRSLAVPVDLRRPVLLLGLFWCGGMIFYLKSIEHIDVSLAALILYSYPVIVLAVSIATDRSAASLKSIPIFVAAFVGLALMLGGGALDVSLLGVLFAGLGACGAAWVFLAGRRVAVSMDSITLALWVNAVGIMLILPLVWGNYDMPQTVQGLLLLASATLCYVLAIICQFQALSRIPAPRAALMFNLEPVVSVLMALLFLGEFLSLVQWLGASLVISVLIGFGVSQYRSG